MFVSVDRCETAVAGADRAYGVKGLSNRVASLEPLDVTVSVLGEPQEDEHGDQQNGEEHGTQHCHRDQIVSPAQ